MSLKKWADNGWLKKYVTNRDEIANLLAIVERDLKDAGEEELSPDWRFGIAYNAALKLCNILLYARGYRASHGAHHYRPIAALPLILGEGKAKDSKYLEACRVKRNIVEYDYVGAVTEEEVIEIRGFTDNFKRDVITWLAAHYPELTSNF